jgi:SAM-dependent methyltransferase
MTTLTPKREFFNGLSARWDGFPSSPDTPEKLARFVSRAVPPSARRVLDAGCGTGILLDPLNACGVALETVVELDAAELMLAQNRLKLEGQPGVSHVCADARSLPFPPASFDAVLCFNALPHLAPMPVALKGMLDCLRPAGLLSVGHLMGSECLNAFHAGTGGAVAHDHLPNAERLRALLAGMDAEVVCAEEASDWYFVQARKRA